MNERDETLLRDMLDMARKARSFLSGRDQAAVDQDELLAFALVRTIEVVGEAASRISPETRAGTPQIPWKAIMGMRNKLIHDYRTVDTGIVWKTVVEELPPLIAELERILPPNAVDE